MQKGDLVILSTGSRRELVVEVAGKYEWVAETPTWMGNYQHQRRVEISTWDADELWHKAGAKPIAGHSIRWTLIRCAKPLPNVIAQH